MKNTSSTWDQISNCFVEILDQSDSIYLTGEWTDCERVKSEIQMYLKAQYCVDVGGWNVQELRIRPHLRHYMKQQKYFPTWVPDAGRKKDVTKGKMQYAAHLVRHSQAGWDLSYRSPSPTSSLPSLPSSSWDPKKVCLLRGATKYHRTWEN